MRFPFDLGARPVQSLRVVPTPTTPAWALFSVLFGSYLIGGISPGWFLVRRAVGGDVRDQGSGGTGATNVGRVLGVKGFVLVLVLDAAKGAAAVLAARALLPGSPWRDLAGPAVIAGHIYPLWLRFKGGKGAGPLLGVALAFAWGPTLLSVTLGILAGLAFRKRFLAGATAYFLNIVFLMWTLVTGPERISYAFAWTLVLLAHRSYLGRYSKP